MILSNSSNLNIEKLRLEPLIFTVAFCIKLLRFIHLELSSRLKNPDFANSKTSFFNENSLLLKWFIKKYFIVHDVIKDEEENLAEIFLSSDFMPEVILFFTEAWNYNVEDRIGLNLITKLIEEFKNILVMKQLQVLFKF